MRHLHSCGRSFRTDAGLAFHASWCTAVAPAAEPVAPAAEPVAHDAVREVRRGPDDAECDMIAGDGFILPRAVAESMNLVRPAPAAEPEPAPTPTVEASPDWGAMMTFAFYPGDGHRASCVARDADHARERIEASWPEFVGRLGIAYLLPNGEYTVNGPSCPNVGPVDVTAEPAAPAEPTPAAEPSDTYCPTHDFYSCPFDVTAEPTPTAARKPAARKPAAPRTAKIPTAGTGKHARCVAHVPTPTAGDGTRWATPAYQCHDVQPTADAIADRAAFVAALDASIATRTAAERARPIGDGKPHDYPQPFVWTAAGPYESDLIDTTFAELRAAATPADADALPIAPADETANGRPTVVDYSAPMPDGFTISDPFGATISDPFGALATPAPAAEPVEMSPSLRASLAFAHGISTRRPRRSRTYAGA